MGAARRAGPAAGGHLRIGFDFPAGQRVLVPALSLLRERHRRVRTFLLQRHTCGSSTNCATASSTSPSSRGPATGTACRAPGPDAACRGRRRERSPARDGARVGGRTGPLPLPARQPRQPGDPRCRRDRGARQRRRPRRDRGLRRRRRRGVKVATEGIVISRPRGARRRCGRSAGHGLVRRSGARGDVYATWREQDANPAVPLFLSTVEETRRPRAIGAGYRSHWQNAVARPRGWPAPWKRAHHDLGLQVRNAGQRAGEFGLSRHHRDSDAPAGLRPGRRHRARRRDGARSAQRGHRDPPAPGSLLRPSCPWASRCWAGACAIRGRARRFRTGRTSIPCPCTCPRDPGSGSSSWPPCSPWRRRRCLTAPSTWPSTSASTRRAPGSASAA